MKTRLILDTADKITVEAVEESATNLVDPGAVLLVVRSGILNHTIPVAIAGTTVALNQDLKALIPGTEVLPKYLSYGVVENIDTTSKQLQQALEEGKTIIVTTLQKFPVIARDIVALPGHRFAVIVDEAHSSQSGESSKSLKAVLASGSLEEAEQEEAAAETPEEELEQLVLAEMAKRGPLPNLSTFAFTATPKPKTLELFGARRPDGQFEPFSLYSMRQAIEEGVYSGRAGTLHDI